MDTDDQEYMRREIQRALEQQREDLRIHHVLALRSDGNYEALQIERFEGNTIIVRSPLLAEHPHPERQP